MADSAVSYRMTEPLRLVDSQLFFRGLPNKPIWQEWGAGAARSGAELRRPMRHQPAAASKWRDATRQAARIVGFDDDAAQRTVAFGDPQALAGHLAGEAGDRRLLLHADHRIVVAAHACIGLVAGPSRQDLTVGGRHVAMRADDERGAAVGKVTHRHLLRRRLTVEI